VAGSLVSGADPPCHWAAPPSGCSVGGRRQRASRPLDLAKTARIRSGLPLRSDAIWNVGAISDDDG
jgi:hypothetical protein